MNAVYLHINIVCQADSKCVVRRSTIEEDTHLSGSEVEHSGHDAALFGLQLGVQDVLAVLV